MGPPSSKLEFLCINDYLIVSWTYAISCESWFVVAPLNHTLSMVCLWLSYHVPSLNKMIKIIGGDIYLLILPKLFSKQCNAKNVCFQELGVSQPLMNAIKKARALAAAQHQD